jgi:hypothetical protein
MSQSNIKNESNSYRHWKALKDIQEENFGNISQESWFVVLLLSLLLL